MPGLYRKGEFDIAGMIVGVAEKKKIVDGRSIRRGNVLIGLPSTGLHTNGYSLARKVLLPRFSLREYRSEIKSTIGDALLAIHRSYLSPIRRMLAGGFVNGMSHITGGGIVGNTMRVIPKGLRIAVDWNAWQRPPIFSLIQNAGRVPENDMRKTFNLGIGLIFVVPSSKSNRVLLMLKQQKETPIVIGEVI